MSAIQGSHTLEHDSRQHANQTVITSRLKKYHVHRPRLSALADNIKCLLGVGHYELHVALVGSRAIRQLNQQFRAKDRTTDVLSFPLQEWAKPLTVRQRPARKPLSLIPELLGDVVISLPDADRNARQIGQGLDREVCFLMIHGILHLCGYDHLQAQDERRMLKAQRLILHSLSDRGKARPLWQGCVRLKQ